MNYEKIVRKIRQKMFHYSPEVQEKAQRILGVAKVKMIAAYPDAPPPKYEAPDLRPDFKAVPGPFGGRKDEQATQDAFVEYVGGIHRAELLARIGRDAYPMPTNGLGEMLTTNEVIRIRAKREGFRNKDVDAYLSL